jgi:phage shock protein PspC (stress-responsive transcriptional regulator)
VMFDPDIIRLVFSIVLIVAAFVVGLLVSY